MLWQNHRVKCTVKITTHISTQLFGQLANLLSVRFRTKWLWVRDYMQLPKLQISLLFRATGCSTFRQLQIKALTWNSYVTWQKHTLKCTVKINTHISAQLFGQLANLLSVRFRTKWLWVRDYMQLPKLQISLLFRATGCSTFRQLQIKALTWNSYVTWQKHTLKCTVKINTHISAQSFGQFGQLVESSFTNKMVVGSRLIAVT